MRYDAGAGSERPPDRPAAEAAAESTPRSWNLDNSHATVEFSVRHLGLASVKGTFHTVTGEVDLDEEDLTRSSGRVEIDVASIDTRDERRDTHLRSADF